MELQKLKQIVEENNLKLNEKFSFLKNIKPHSYEWTGLDLETKQVAIFYITQSKKKKFISEVIERGYEYETSTFSFDDNNSDKIEKNKQTSGDRIVFYIGKSKDILAEFKELDYKHMFPGNDPINVIHDRIRKIGSYLGIPECCTDYYLKTANGDEFKTEKTKKYCDYSENKLPHFIETFSRAVPYINSESKEWMLNNFASLTGFICDFFPCSYDCKKALAISKKHIEHYEKNNSFDSKELEKALKIPMIFFSPNMTIFLDLISVKESDNITEIEYSDAFFHLLNYNTKSFIEKMFIHIKNGNKLIISDDDIKIFYNNKPLAKINKRYEYEGIFIQF